MEVRIPNADIDEVVEALDVITDAKIENGSLILQVSNAEKIRNIFSARDILLKDSYIEFVERVEEEQEDEEVVTPSNPFLRRGFAVNDDFPSDEGYDVVIETPQQNVSNVIPTGSGFGYFVYNCSTDGMYLGHFFVVDHGGTSVSITPKYKYGDVLHPHARESSGVCFGNIEDNLKDTKDFWVRLELITAFLNSADPNDEWGSVVNDYPTVAEWEEYING